MLTSTAVDIRVLLTVVVVVVTRRLDASDLLDLIAPRVAGLRAAAS